MIILQAYRLWKRYAGKPTNSVCYLVKSQIPGLLQSTLCRSMTSAQSMTVIMRDSSWKLLSLIKA